MRHRETRSSTLVAVCAAASLGLLLVAGALCALPATVLPLAPASRGVRLAALTTCAPAFTLVGLLGAATLIWQAGRPALGAVLSGVTVMAQLAGPVVMFVGLGPYTALVLTLLARAGAGTTVIITMRRPGERPRWQVTLSAGLVALAPLPAFLLQPPVYISRPPPTGDPWAALDEYYLSTGLAFLAAGVVAGLIAGAHALLSSAAAGLMLGAFSMLVALSRQEMRDMPVLTVVVTVGSLLVGIAAGQSRWRAQIGMIEPVHEFH